MKLTIEKLKKYQEIFIYGVVGVATNLLDFILYLFILKLTNNFILAENLKIPFVLSFNYISHRLFTFKTKGSKKKEGVKYILANIIIWIIANITLALLVGIIREPRYAKAAQLVIMPIVTYVIFKTKVFVENK